MLVVVYGISYRFLKKNFSDKLLEKI
jgi:hypothetical protein